MVKVEVEVDVWSSTVTLLLFEGSKSLELFRKFEASGSDKDFGEFADWVSEDVADELEFNLESARIVP